MKNKKYIIVYNNEDNELQKWTDSEKETEFLTYENALNYIKTTNKDLDIITINI